MVKRVFISQPMRNKSDEDVLATRDHAKKILSKYLEYMGDSLELISSFFTEDDIPSDIPEDVNSIWYLGRSITMLSKADACFFCDGWENARGCVIERNVCDSYGIEILDEKYVNEFITLNIDKAY